MDYVKSIDFKSEFEAVNELDALPGSYIPPFTTRDMPMDDVSVDESKVETNEEHIHVMEESIYRDLSHLEIIIV